MLKYNDIKQKSCSYLSQFCDPVVCIQCALCWLEYQKLEDVLYVPKLFLVYFAYSVGLNTCMNASLEKLMALKEVIFEASKFAKSPVFPC